MTLPLESNISTAALPPKASTFMNNRLPSIRNGFVVRQPSLSPAFNETNPSSRSTAEAHGASAVVQIGPLRGGLSRPRVSGFRLGCTAADNRATSIRSSRTTTHRHA